MSTFWRSLDAVVLIALPIIAGVHFLAKDYGAANFFLLLLILRVIRMDRQGGTDYRKVETP